MQIHCGTQWLGTFNGQSWFADDAPLPSMDWPRLGGGGVDGLLKLVDADLIEYRIIGTDIVIEYQPTPEKQPDCF